MTSTPRPQCRSRPLHHHPFVDNIAIKCYDVKRGTEAGGKMKRIWIVIMLQCNIPHRGRT